MSKNILIILLILLSIIACNKKILSKNNEKANNANSTNYKHYSNDDYGFQFKYPAESEISG